MKWGQFEQTTKTCQCAIMSQNHDMTTDEHEKIIWPVLGVVPTQQKVLLNTCISV